MARYRIPLQAGNAYFSISTNLSGRSLRLSFRWMTLYGFYAVDIHEDDRPIILGKGLHPDVDLLSITRVGLGALYIEGEQPSIDNLGVTNTLIYDDRGAGDE